MNRKEMYDRLLSLLVGTFVRENFSATERRAVLALLKDRDFNLDLHQTVAAVLKVVDERGTGMRVPSLRQKNLDLQRSRLAKDSEELLEKLLSLIRYKRLSKTRVISWLSRIDPDLTSRLSDEDGVASIVQMFFIHATENQRRAMVDMLDPDRDEDDYLRGISERNKS
ncbi:hypothetical protein J2797_003076 [Paraburkholderia terricola]|uniref:hypothetical protein n=1 Tax=Paraburkholderia terricola TaxID=169427 RepID=UPI002866A34B|nr:hypothetical protein [Paraburkholderia terricola]MDR6493180.1 hypothetical protein [Paraburkholderia terricola]